MKGSKTPKKLSAAEGETLLATLKARFEKHAKRHEGIAWGEVRARLEARPEKLWSLREMEDTGGDGSPVAPSQSRTCAIGYNRL